MKKRNFIILAVFVLVVFGSFVVSGLECVGTQSINCSMWDGDGDACDVHYFVNSTGNFQCLRYGGSRCSDIVYTPCSPQNPYFPGYYGLVYPPYFYNVNINVTSATKQYILAGENVNFSSIVSSIGRNPWNVDTAQFRHNFDISYLANQSSLSQSGWGVFGGKVKFGQSFKFRNSAGYIYEACFMISNSPNNISRGDIDFSLYQATSTGIPQGSYLSKATLLASGLNGSANFYCVNFTNSVYIQQNRNYAIIVSSPSSSSTQSYYRYQNNSNPYPDGGMLIDTGKGTITSYNGLDSYFSVKIGNFSYQTTYFNINSMEKGLSIVKKPLLARAIPYNYKWCANSTTQFINIDDNCYSYSIFVLESSSKDRTPPQVRIDLPKNKTRVNGGIIIEGYVEDASGIGRVGLFYKNSTQTSYSYLTGCEKLEDDYDCLWDMRNSTAFNDTTYYFKLEGCNLYGICKNSSVMTYYTDRNTPYILTKSVIYPSGQTSIKNNQQVSFIVNVSDYDSGINNTQINLSWINNSEFGYMVFSKGSLSASNSSVWNTSSTTTTAYSGTKQIFLKISDNVSGFSNVLIDSFNVPLDNFAPQYSNLEIGSSAPYSVGEQILFDLDATDNYQLKKYIFSTNLAGSWANDSEVNFSGTLNYATVQKTLSGAGSFSYRFFLYDDAGNINSTAINNFNVVSTSEGINISLISPAEGETISSNPFLFYYNYTGEDANSCVLYADSEEITVSPTKATNIYFNHTLTDSGLSMWYIGCNNSNGKFYYSEIRTFTQNVTLKLTPEVNQSKFVNNGNNPINLYFLMHVDYFNITSDSWNFLGIVINDTNSTSLRYFSPGDTGGLDLIWNTIGFNSSIGKDGLNTYRAVVSAVDPNGNMLKDKNGVNLTASYNFSISLDYSTPQISISSPIHYSNYSVTSVSFNISSNEILSACFVSLNDFVTTNYTMAFNPAKTSAGFVNLSIEDGDYQAVFWCNDTSNNINDSEWSTFKIDTTGPVISVNNPTNISYSNTNVLINFSAEDELSPVSSLWYYNGTGNTSYISSHSIGLIDGSYTFIFYANDSLGNFASQSVTFSILSNLAPNNPSVTINSTDGSNKTLADLNCFATITDPNAGSKLNVSVVWYKNNVTNLTIDYNNSYTTGTLFVATLNNANTTKGQNWSCGMRTYDGSLYSNWINSTQLIILNSLPIITLVSPSNGNITTNRTPTFSWSAQDDDGDSLNYEINITTRPTGSEDNRYVSGIVTASYTPTNDLRYLHDNNYYYEWSVHGNDSSFGNWSSVRTINISALLILDLDSNSMDFGVLNIGQSDNTTDNFPQPFSFNNSGNCIVNVSVSATPIWTSIVANNSYYRFKIDNRTGQSGAFSWLSSITGWTNVLTGAVVGVSGLNYSTNKNGFEADVYLEVPGNENPGNKSSTMIFTSSLAE